MSETPNNDGRATHGVSEAKDTRKGVQSVDHAFAILKIMEANDRPLAVKELSSLSGMAPSKVHHYLVSLARSGVIQQNDRGEYDLGPFALQIGMSALRRLDVIALASRAAETLRNETGNATFIAVWGSHGATIVRYFEGFKPVTVEVRAGLVLPVHTSATGRVFLTWGNPEQVEKIASGEQTTNAEEVRSICQQTKATGLGKVVGDLLPRIASLSAPVFDRENRLVLALTSLGWTEQFDTDPHGENAAALKAAAKSLSQALAHSPR